MVGRPSGRAGPADGAVHRGGDAAAPRLDGLARRGPRDEREAGGDRRPVRPGPAAHRRRAGDAGAGRSECPVDGARRGAGQHRRQHPVRGPGVAGRGAPDDAARAGHRVRGEGPAMTRLVLVLIVLAFFVLCAGGMWWGWRNKARRQAETVPALPAAPSELGGELLPETTGVYVSTTLDDSWQNRVAVGDVGFRSEATLHLHDKGLLIDRVGASPVWIPRDAVRDARVGQGLAGEVML